MENQDLARLIMLGCQRAGSTRGFRRSGPDWREVVAKVYHDVSRGVQNNPDHYGSPEHVTRTADRQAKRELRKQSASRRPPFDRTKRRALSEKPVTFGFSDATTLGRDGFSRCVDPLDAAVRAEESARLDAWAATRRPDDQVILEVLRGELTKSAAGQILGIHASTIARRCDRLVSAARRDLMKESS